MLRVIVGLGLALTIALTPGAAGAQVRVVIDAGHGGTDPGGVGTSLQEKNVVLDVSQRFKALLDADSADESGGGKWTALMTRSNDTFVSLAARSGYSNNQDADRFMSIHSNAHTTTSANGIETFSFAATGTAAGLRNLVQAEMIAAWGLTDRGNKTATFAVLRDTAAPAVLHELAFITNATDAAKLGSPTERQKAAVAHLRGLQRHYNLTPYLPGDPTPQPDAGEIAGRVVDVDRPIVAARVSLAGGTTVVTDAEGVFVFTSAAAGTHTLTASAEGYMTETVEVTVAAAVRTEIEITLEPGDDAEPDPTGDDASGGCTTTPGAGLALLVALASLRGRRRGRRS